ncbi:MAG TPA: pyroglutamyl-peptidase I [Mesotoga infera]|uniref:Pyroglutamyl-peptidase I n=1 Tax=Mesotoga infera TaxID=1236046 RepID=A0A7C1H6X2_9BACT|nr:pyroglutamyl-peptidase I [Mesotoga infera]
MILVTHFDPFGGSRINASQIVAQLLADLREDIELMSLPTVFDDSFSPLKLRLLKGVPEALIMIGQAAGRSLITPEKVAINWKESATPDNNGFIATGEKIISASKDAYFSKLPIERIVSKLKDEGLPIEKSFSAGAFVCNYLFYRCMDFLTMRGIDIPAGFVHIPCIPEQTSPEEEKPAIKAEVSAKVLSRIIDLALEENR